MHKLIDRRQGFTIVELLIVVVVIAILAAISVVAFTGIQDRANDSAVQNDLSNFAKKIQLIAVETDSYPAGGSGSGDAAKFPGFTFSPSKSAYYTASSLNLTYCTGPESSSGQMIFQIQARSKSGNAFMYRSNGGMQDLGNVTIGGSSQACTGIDSWTYSRGYSSGWASWID